MPLISLATFNANNFFLRYKFGQAYPGGEQNAAALVADEEAGVGYLPGLAFGRYGRSQYVIWDGVRRELAARALAAPDGRLPDVLCLQEVENIHAIRLFNERHLGSHYGYALLIDGYERPARSPGSSSRGPADERRSSAESLSAGQGAHVDRHVDPRRGRAQ